MYILHSIYGIKCSIKWGIFNNNNYTGFYIEFLSKYCSLELSVCYPVNECMTYPSINSTGKLPIKAFIFLSAVTGSFVFEAPGENFSQPTRMRTNLISIQQYSVGILRSSGDLQTIIGRLTVGYRAGGQISGNYSVRAELLNTYKHLLLGNWSIIWTKPIISPPHLIGWRPCRTFSAL